MAYNLFERWYRDTRKKIVKVEGAPQKNTITPYTDPYSECDYIPANGDSPIIETVPGTHATADLLAHLVFNRFFLDTPVYREKYRLMKERMRVSRQTVSNWLLKGADFIKFIIEQLMEQCLEKDSIVNCDETWCRVKVGGEVHQTSGKREEELIVLRKSQDGARKCGMSAAKIHNNKY